MTTNYLQMMIDSLNKKKEILTRIVALNDEQDAILVRPQYLMMQHLILT